MIFLVIKLKLKSVMLYSIGNVVFNIYIISKNNYKIVVYGIFSSVIRERVFEQISR